MSHNKYLTLPIKGMHCRSCELIIEEKLKEISHVKSVDVNYRDGKATIYYEGSEPDMKNITQVIVEAGYEIGHSDKLPLLSRDKKPVRVDFNDFEINKKTFKVGLANGQKISFSKIKPISPEDQTYLNYVRKEFELMSVQQILAQKQAEKNLSQRRA